MTVARGDVVILNFPQAPGSPPKRRPAVVIQSDHNNTRLTSSIFVMVTSNIQLATVEATQVFVDPSTPEGNQSGLARPSAVKCENIHTLPTANVYRTIGKLDPALMQQVEAALKMSLALP